MNSTVIDFHLLHTVPPSNLNRDDTGSPKTSVYGGVRRARVSSQAWKRATRTTFSTLLDESDLGVRTKRVVELLSDRIRTLRPDLEESLTLQAAVDTLGAAKISVKEPRGKKGAPAEAGYLLFLSTLQINALAELAVQAIVKETKPATKDAQALIKNKNSIDLALFGRMVADVSDLNVDAACQVAHAISTHAVENEYDYFTAVDDHKASDAEEDHGAGMIGTVEFNSSTLYRYATINVDRLNDNLGDPEAAARAVEAFTKAFTLSMPTGKQNTFANRTLPDGIVITVRTDQPVSWAGAFEEPVRDTASGGRTLTSAQRLATYALDVQEAYGSPAARTWVIGVGEIGEALTVLGERSSFAGAVDDLGGMVRDRLAGSGLE